MHFADLLGEWKKVDPDQLVSAEKPADLDPHCFLKRIYSAGKGFIYIHIQVAYFAIKI